MRRREALGAMILGTAGWAGGTALAQPLSAQEQVLKAAFIYRFAQMTEWPSVAASSAPKPFLLCVAGQGSLHAALRSLSGKALGGTLIQVQGVSQPSGLGSCQVLVLDMEDRHELNRWQRAVQGEPVLTIGDGPEAFRAGVMIALATEPDGLAFRINRTEARARGLSMSPQVLKLAKEVR